VFGRVGADGLVADRHAEAIEALQAKNADGARRAIAADLSEGMDKMRAAVGTDA
jgi:DNA-binding GntR family transcriptional regulator